ncbi:hypothetical protein OSB04_007503 [Centaurea solstitialis]|uniref:Uncharacterized protein n=1 Tax=Centaurea solstitialis TaxID=347529 RepID=A0AA38U4J7_9ASTR|nr:hypothetical protein OSB04_007503 [Centaurea solstitialis]
MVPFNASENQDSDFGSSSRDPTDSGRVEKRNNLMRAGVGEAAMRSCSSIMLLRSSSVVMEMRASRSSFGSWYLRAKGRFPYRVRERWWVSAAMVAAVVRRSTATMRGGREWEWVWEWEWGSTATATAVAVTVVGGGSMAVGQDSRRSCKYGAVVLEGDNSSKPYHLGVAIESCSGWRVKNINPGTTRLINRIEIFNPNLWWGMSQVVSCVGGSSGQKRKSSTSCKAIAYEKTPSRTTPFNKIFLTTMDPPLTTLTVVAAVDPPHLHSHTHSLPSLPTLKIRLMYSYGDHIVPHP